MGVVSQPAAHPTPTDVTFPDTIKVIIAAMEQERKLLPVANGSGVVTMLSKESDDDIDIDSLIAGDCLRAQLLPKG